jgi:hypothetical protein
MTRGADLIFKVGVHNFIMRNTRGRGRGFRNQSVLWTDPLRGDPARGFAKSTYGGGIGKSTDAYTGVENQKILHTY